MNNQVDVLVDIVAIAYLVLETILEFILEYISCYIGNEMTLKHSLLNDTQIHVNKPQKLKRFVPKFLYICHCSTPYSLDWNANEIHTQMNTFHVSQK